ncbi:P-loop domain-containing protein [Saccharothrix syringae]|uniref:Nephrocystin 3-like N-terminal domain-containing protein n=1 Tax=Saccharothrix syringae TaxID=103733 RepID=A0A5Q0H6U2_SACSY|nr:hypothetical protein [Saccharothrix syringae]QFZ21560.1 hypothetical protein EKG83_32930 [Saccharothrix syringae]
MPGDESTAGAHNEVTGSADAIVQAGSIRGGVHLTARGPLVRSAYLEQVARIAPEELRDRGAELAELASWCSGDGEPYRWLRAPAWAGKSALMSWFALHPPEGVRVVSFFVTARLSGQSDKTAFAEVVIEQLAELLREPLPPLLTDATRDAHLLGLLGRAAAACRERGERLVLLVDGLDEDRRPGGHSIAALLPRVPVAGSRVLVSGRPDPPVPADVPARHPLRDPGVVRELSRSTHAAVARADAERELAHLLRGDETGQELLGLVAAAGGGVTAADLAELSGRPVWEVEEQLGAVTGRTFSRRGRVYLMAHEQLQQDAVRMLGGARLAGFRRRLHEWADAHRDRGWPAGTPEYLLVGYFRLLRETGEVARLTRCALDRARHARLADLTGGDSAALTEVAAAQEVLHGQADPDLLAVVRLGIHRDELVNRNVLVPAGLPEAWVRLGQVARAEALAWSLPDPAQRARALLAVSRAVAATGDAARAEAIGRVAHPWERSVRRVSEEPSPGGRRTYSGARRTSRSRVDEVLEALKRGDVELGARLAMTLPRGRRESVVWVALVRALARKGRLSRAEVVARGIKRSVSRAEALTALVVPLADAGDTARAEALATEAERVVRLADVLPEPEVVTGVLVAAASAGDVGTAEALARSLADSRQRDRALAGLVGVVARGGDVGRADAVAATVEDPHLRALAVLAVGRARGDVGRCSDEVRALVGAVRHAYERDEVRAALSAALADGGDFDGAERVARAVGNPEWRGRALVHLAGAVAATGDLDRADAVATGDQALAVVARVVGDPVRARAVPDPRWRVHALAGLVGAVSVDELVAALGEVGYTAQRVQASREVAVAIAARGEVERAERFARSIAVPSWRARALADLVPVVARTGLDRARALAGAIDDPGVRARALASLVPLCAGVEAERLVVAVVAEHEWRAVLPVLPGVRPDIASAVARDLLAVLRERAV